MDAELVALVINNPKLAATCTVMYLLRLVMKPVCSAINKYIQDTPSKNDDTWLAEFLDRPVVKQLVYLIDMFASIKIQAKELDKKP
jgi:hypothetical protein